MSSSTSPSFDLWNLLETTTPSSSSSSAEAFALVLGARACGKSTLIAQCLGGNTKDEAPKATTALDYTPVRNPFSIENNNNNNSNNNSNSSSNSSSSNTVPSSSSSNISVAHVWELGGGPSLSFADLVAVPITPQRFPTGVFVLVLDLSNPGDICATALRWIQVVKRRVDECVEKLKGRKQPQQQQQQPVVVGGGTPAVVVDNTGLSVDAIFQQTQARLRVGYAQRTGQRAQLRPETSTDTTNFPANGVETPPTSLEATPSSSSQPPLLPLTHPAVVTHVLGTYPEHQDWKMQLTGGTLFPMQTIIVGTRWDTLRDAEAPKRRVVLATLRFLGVCLGAHVVCTSSREKSTLAAFRALFLHAAFGLEAGRGCIADTDGNRPLFIPAGADTLDAVIGGGGSNNNSSSRGGSSSGGGNTSTSSSSSSSTPLLRKQDVEAGPFATRLEKFAALIRQYYAPSAQGQADLADDGTSTTGSGNGTTTTESKTGDGSSSSASSSSSGSSSFQDDAAVLYPEPVIDMMRAAKEEELVKYMREQKEKERRLVLEQKAAAAGAVGAAPRQQQ